LTAGLAATALMGFFGTTLTLVAGCLGGAALEEIDFEGDGDGFLAVE
jgi:ABC-type dipeptide/oligopeptide/nickel transport system permease subunit